MRSRLASLCLLALVVVGSVAVASPAAAADARLTLTGTTVAPATPTVGAPITATTTLRLSAGSNTSMAVDEVRVVGNDTDTVYGTATELGTLSPGETLDVPVTFTVNESGAHDLRVVAVGNDTDGDAVEATRPLTVGVEPGQPQVEFDTDEYVAGADTQVQATVSNPTTAAIRDIRLGDRPRTGRKRGNCDAGGGHLSGGEPLGGTVRVGQPHARTDHELHDAKRHPAPVDDDSARHRRVAVDRRGRSRGDGRG
mgnify:CR=1 FL=1